MISEKTPICCYLLVLSFLTLASLGCNTTDTDSKYSLTTSTFPDSIGNIKPSEGNYAFGEEVVLTVQSPEGWRFNNWDGDTTGSHHPLTVTMNSDKHFTAVFEQGGYVSHGYVEGITPSSKEEFAERTYPTVRADWDGEGGDKLWTKKNLGAVSLPHDKKDRDPDRRGWIFQFNRKQAYHYEGNFNESNRIPNTGWESNITEDSDWEKANDPCSQLFGDTWRLPTHQEWQNFHDKYYTQENNLSFMVSAFTSPLKLHSPLPEEMFLPRNEQSGAYWSKTQSGEDSGRYLRIPSPGTIWTLSKKNGLLVRCIKD